MRVRVGVREKVMRGTMIVHQPENDVRVEYVHAPFAAFWPHEMVMTLPSSSGVSAKRVTPPHATCVILQVLRKNGQPVRDARMGGRT